MEMVEETSTSLEDPSEQGFFSRIRSLIKKRDSLGNADDLTEEIHDLMGEGQAKGLISNEESDMVDGVLHLRETNAHSIMVPRTEISSISVEATLGEVIALVTSCGHTRIPIHKNSIDEIVGLLNAKDILKLWGQDPETPIPASIIRKPYFVPGNQKASELLKDLRDKKTHLAIVTDEYGGTAGIITIEDILEEIVGEIMDEHDPEESLMETREDGALLVDARLEAEKLEERIGITLPEGDFESVGGFIIHLLGHIPKTQEQILYGDFEFTIQSADRRRIGKIVITPISQHKEKETSGGALT